MGHRDSSAQFGGDDRIFDSDARVVETASSRASARDGFKTKGMTSGLSTMRIRSAASWILLLLIRFYIAFMSPFFGGACKFHPSCSNYAHEAIARHGARRGLLLATKRLLRCRPFVKGGFDPVPEAYESADAAFRIQRTESRPL